MALIATGDLNLTEVERLTVAIKGWCALDTETGAFLARTHGRPKAGNGYKYVLILPNEPVQERGLFGSYTWDCPQSRKFIRAWSDDEAIQFANQKLEKMIQSRRPLCFSSSGS